MEGDYMYLVYMDGDTKICNTLTEAKQMIINNSLDKIYLYNTNDIKDITTNKIKFLKTKLIFLLLELTNLEGFLAILFLETFFILFFFTIL